MAEIFNSVWQWLAGGLSGAMLLLLGWLGGRSIKRLDDIEDDYLSRTEFREVIREMIKDQRQIAEDIRMMHKRIDQLCAERKHHAE